MTLSEWPALILAAGYGTRLRPLTNDRAKPAVPVAGVPLIIRLLRWLSRWGVQDVVINLHYKPQTITAVVGDGQLFGVNVRYSWEPSILGSAGGPARAFLLHDAERWLIVNGDTLTDVDLARLTDRHRSSGALVTLAVVPNPDPSRYGGVIVRDDVVTGFTPASRNPPDTCHFVGVQTVERSAFEGVPVDRRSESVGELYPRLIASQPGSVRAFVSNVRFFDIGMPDDYVTTSRSFEQANGPKRR
ncbi:MAG: nucleotidyltransferase family protein [Acidobacteria bacterium]|nr:nucleotidyltransferase family protein [Acidobacteriota bacterium]MBI3264199.1 nucleotidyltransferase family protein [Acidobacteriota bacterium]